MAIKKKKTNTARLIRLDDATTKCLKIQADAQKRSLKNFIEHKLTELVNEGKVTL